MNKHLSSLLCLFALPVLLCAQALNWHKQLTTEAYFTPFLKLIPEGDHVRIHTNRAIFQMDQNGAVTHFLDFNAPVLTAHSATKKYLPGTGHPYFVLARRTGNNSKDYSLAAYRPGQGYMHETVFQDSLFISTFPRPQILEIADNSYLVFGRLFYRKINYDPATGFSEEWARPLTIFPIVVAQLNGLLVLADEKGALQALDATGNQVWMRNHPVQFRALKPVSGGFIACGKTANNEAAVIRLNADGTAAWFKTYSGIIFNDIIRTTDGGYAAVGLSAAKAMSLVKLDGNGEQDWERTYGNGAGDMNSGGAAVLELPGGGYIFLGKGIKHLHCIRTDALGNAPDAQPEPAAYRILKNAALQTDIYPGAMQFFNGNDATFLALEDSIAATIFAFNTWVGANDPAGGLHLAAGMYNTGGNSDYRPGGAGTARRDFERVWAVSRSEIRSLREDFRLDNNLNNPVPFDLLTWPARGNPHLRYNLDFSPVSTDPDLFPAPFVDVDSDGIYDVYNGDYPVIKGERMAWWLFTDSTDHTVSHGNPLVFDFQALAYTFDCAQNPAVEKSLFLEYTIVNRSGNDYTNAFLGFYTDPDLGCHLDDYIGTAPQADSWYVYNADAVDETCLGIQGFGSKVPVQSISFLNRSLDLSIYMANPIPGNPPLGIPIDPSTPSEYAHFLRGDFTITRGGSGFNNASTDTVRHIFLDNPSDPQGWSMCSESFPQGDWRFVNSHGPFQLGANDTFVMQLAFTRHSDIQHPCPDIFGLVVPPLQQLKQWNADGEIELQPDLAPVYTLGPGQTLELDASVPGAGYAWSTGSSSPVLTVSMPGNYTVTITGATGCERVENIFVQSGTGADEPAALQNWKLWPNPARDRVYIDCPDCDAATLQTTLYNAQGRLLSRSSGAVVGLQALPAGVYWLEVRDAWNWLGVRRVLVQ